MLEPAAALSSRDSARWVINNRGDMHGSGATSTGCRWPMRGGATMHILYDSRSSTPVRRTQTACGGNLGESAGLRRTQNGGCASEPV